MGAVMFVTVLEVNSGIAHSTVLLSLAIPSPSPPPPLSLPLQWLRENPLKDTSLVRHLFGARGTDRLYSKNFFRYGLVWGGGGGGGGGEGEGVWKGRGLQSFVSLCV